MKKRILVTGGAGFIGSHLVDALVKDGHEIGVIDNLVHGDKSRLSNQIKFFEKDIRSKQLLFTFKEFRPEIVYHLAAQQDVGKANNNPMYDASVNILGTLNILECCRKTRVKKIIYSDSVAGFGEPKKFPIPVDHLRDPQSFYGISKHTVEHYLQAYQRYFGIEFVGLILANVYGPRQDPYGEGGVIAIFFQRMTHKQPVYIFGDGEQTRDFIFVKDIVRAFLQAIQHGTNQFHMIGTGKKTSINKLFKLVSKLSGYKNKPIYKLLRSGDVKASVFDTKATKKYLNWEANICLQEGLWETSNYFDKL